MGKRRWVIVLRRDLGEAGPHFEEIFERARETRRIAAELLPHWQLVHADYARDYTAGREVPPEMLGVPCPAGCAASVNGYDLTRRLQLSGCSTCRGFGQRPLSLELRAALALGAQINPPTCPDITDLRADARYWPRWYREAEAFCSPVAVRERALKEEERIRARSVGRGGGVGLPHAGDLIRQRNGQRSKRGPAYRPRK